MCTHSKEKPFKCDVDGCDFTAATSTGLTCEHSLRCVLLLSSCDAFASNNKVSLCSSADHTRSQHTKEKPFLCDVEGCGYATVQKGDLASKLCVCGCED